ncbi:MAG: alpha/beta fold hydrolase [candidate division Zixibacteria bacterium]|nr:alpha/beta fold hydrolase [candidate division Zixibacteria bacterium]
MAFCGSAADQYDENTARFLVRAYNDSVWVAAGYRDFACVCNSGVFKVPGASEANPVVAIELTGYCDAERLPDAARKMYIASTYFIHGPVIPWIPAPQSITVIRNGTIPPAKDLKIDLDIDTYEHSTPGCYSGWNFSPFVLDACLDEGLEWLDVFLDPLSVDGTDWKITLNTSDVPLGTYQSSITASLGNACVHDAALSSQFTFPITLNVIEAPVITEINDPGQGDALQVKFTGVANPSVTQYTVAVSTRPGDVTWIKRTFVSAQGAVTHTALLEGLQPNFPYYVKVLNPVPLGSWVYPTSDTANYASTPVLLVHGINSSAADAWSDFIPWLSARHFNHIWAPDLVLPSGAEGEVNFDFNTHGLSLYLDDRLAQLSQKTGLVANRVNIVAHSMGGLVSRRLLWERRTLDVPNLIMMGTPNGGVDWIPLALHLFGGPIKLFSPAVYEMSPPYMADFNKLVKNRPSTKYTNVVGVGGRADYACSSRPNITCEPRYRIGTQFTNCPNDGTVSKASMIDPAQGSQEAEYPELVCHSSYMHFAPIFDFVYDRLRSSDLVQEPPLAAIPTEAVLPPQITHSICDSVSQGASVADTMQSEGGTLTVRVVTNDSSAYISIQSPSGTVYDSSNVGSFGDASFSSGQDGTAFSFVDAPTGNWIVRISAVYATIPTVYFCSEVYQSNSTTCTAAVDSVYRTVGDSVTVFTEVLDGSLPVPNCVVTALPIRNLTDTLALCDLYDSGLGADMIAGDGIYTGRFEAAADSGTMLIWLKARGTNSQGIQFERIALPFVHLQLAYICGDADGSTAVSISDAVYLINYIFAGGPAPNPPLAGDADCSSAVSISDAVYLINYIFAGGPAPCAACP